MRIRIEVQDGAVVVRALGWSLRTGSGARRLWDALEGLLRNEVRRVVLDLGRVRFLDGGALEGVLAGERSFRRSGARLHLVAPSLVFAPYLVRLRSDLQAFPDLARALEGFAAPEVPRPQPAPAPLRLAS